MIRALVAFVLLGLFHTAPLFGDDTRTVSVAGYGEVTVEPDNARIELAVSLAGKDLRAAKQDIDKVMAALLEVTKQLKIEDDDVAATELQVVPEWDYEKQRNTDFFEMSRSMTVTLRKLARLDTLLDALIDEGANRVDGIVLETSIEKELKGQALTLVISNAREQANKIAEILDVTLGKVHQVTGGAGPYVSLSSAPIEGLSSETYKPAKIKIGVEIGVVYQLK